VPETSVPFELKLTLSELTPAVLTPSTSAPSPFAAAMDTVTAAGEKSMMKMVSNAGENLLFII